MLQTHTHTHTHTCEPVSESPLKRTTLPTPVSDTAAASGGRCPSDKLSSFTPQSASQCRDVWRCVTSRSFVVRLTSKNRDAFITPAMAAFASSGVKYSTNAPGMPSRAKRTSRWTHPNLEHSSYTSLMQNCKGMKERDGSEARIWRDAFPILYLVHSPLPHALIDIRASRDRAVDNTRHGLRGLMYVLTAGVEKK